MNFIKYKRSLCLLSIFFFFSCFSISEADTLYLQEDGNDDITLNTDQQTEVIAEFDTTDAITGSSSISVYFERVTGSNANCFEIGISPNTTHGSVIVDWIIPVGTYTGDIRTFATNAPNFSLSANTHYYVLAHIATPGCSGNIETNSAEEFQGYITTDGDIGYNPTNTRIVSFYPTEGTTTASTTVDFGFHVYISPDDFSNFEGVRIIFHNVDQNNLFGTFLSDDEITFVDDNATTSGHWYYASTTELAEGNYRITIILQRSFAWGIINNPFSSINDEQNHQFIVGTSTFIGNISQNSYNSLRDLYDSRDATSTESLANQCNPIIGFDPIGCFTFLLIPDAGYLSDTITEFRQTIATHFPLGYVNDFINIVSTTSASSLTIIDATLPAGIAGTGAHITLSLNNVLDRFLNATTSSYTNASASSTQTLFEITNQYWKYIMYVLTLFYIMGRILGSHIIPKITHAR